MLILQPIAFCWFVFLSRIRGETRTKLLVSARRLAQEPLLTFVALLLAVVGLIWAFMHP
jgi:hypothetical protein